MTYIDIEKYRDSWKNERSFNEKKLSQSEISEFIRTASKSIVVLYRKGLLFDIFYKLILLVSIIVLISMTRDQTSWFYINLFLGSLLILGIAYQRRILTKIPNRNHVGQNFLGLLRGDINYFYKFYIISIFIGASSNAIFFLIGSLYYLHFKYQEIPNFDVHDIIVLGIGLILSYGIGAFVQLKQNKFQVNQLEVRLKEVEENSITQQSLEVYKKSKNRNNVLIIIGLIIGLCLFIFLIYKYFI